MIAWYLMRSIQLFIKSLERSSNMQEIKPCIFCGGINIKFSIKVASRKRTSATYHACMYCDDCKASSPRVLVHVTCNNRILVENDEYFKEQALELWNRRVV